MSWDTRTTSASSDRSGLVQSDQDAELDSSLLASELGLTEAEQLLRQPATDYLLTNGQPATVTADAALADAEAPVWPAPAHQLAYNRATIYLAQTTTPATAATPTFDLDPDALSADPDSLQRGFEEVTAAAAHLDALDARIGQLWDNDPRIDAVVAERNQLATDITTFRAAAESLIPDAQDAHSGYLATRIGSPERIAPTLSTNPLQRQSFGITTDAGQTVLATGSKVTYTLNLEPALSAEPPSIRVIAINDADAVAAGEADAIVSRDLGTDNQITLTADASGTHAIVFEVQYEGLPPTYHTWQQEVVSPAQLASQSLDSLIAAPPQPALLEIGFTQQIAAGTAHLAALRELPGDHEDEIEATENALDELRESLDAVTTALADDAIADAVPMRAVLVAAENSAVVPLQVYARPMADGQWAIVDVTNPMRVRVYEGDTSDDAAAGLESAWNEFIANNDLPSGRIAAAPPQTADGYESDIIADALDGLSADPELWQQDSDGQSGFAAWRDGLGVGSLVLAGLGVAAVIAAPFTGGATAAAVPWLFGAAGVTGAASAGFNIADRVVYGGFEWRSTETALDLLGIVGGITAFGSSATTIARSGATTIVTANGARITIDQADDLGRWLMLSSQVDTVAGAASTVLVSREYLQQIEAVRNDPTLSEQAKAEQVNGLMQEALAVGALMVLGLAAGSRATTNAAAQAPETIALQNLRNGLDGAALDTLIATHGRDAVVWAGQELDGPAARRLLGQLDAATVTSLSGQAPGDIATLVDDLQRVGVGDIDALLTAQPLHRVRAIADVMIDSNPQQRMSLINTERVLDDYAPTGYVLDDVAGSGGAGADLVFVNPTTGDTFGIENKSTIGRNSFNSLLRHAAQEQGADLVFVQVPEGTDAQNWLSRFIGSRPVADRAAYADVDIVVADPAGNILLERQPIYSPDQQP